jgi:AAA domain
VEGEDDAEALRAEGVVATTAPMGAGNVDKCDLSPLYGAAKVLVGVDKDPAGHKRAAVLRELLAGHVDQLEFRQAKSGKDIADHLAAGYTLDELEQLEQEDAPASDHEYRVQYELGRIRVREDARRRYEAEQRPLMPPFDAGTLAEMLDKPAEPPSRVEGLIPWEASTLITAQRKAGKTTLDLNLARSLLTGEDFLGRFGVRPLDGIVAMLKFEVSGAQLVRWADEAGIPRDRLFLVNLRGRRNPFTAEEDRQALAALLRGREVEAVLTDPFGRAYSGTSQNDPGEVGAWLADLDRWVRGSVGARDSVLTTHAGWNAERTRGSSALEDWADSIITLVRDDEEHGDGERYLRAIGRDVEVEEDRLIFEPETRCLRLAGAGSRKAAKGVRREEQLKAAILRIVEGQPWLNGSEIEHRLPPLVSSSSEGRSARHWPRWSKTASFVSNLARGTRNSTVPPQPPQPPQASPWGTLGPSPTPL